MSPRFLTENAAAVTDALLRLRTRSTERAKMNDTANRLISRLAHPGLFLKTAVQELIDLELGGSDETILAAVLGAAQKIELKGQELFRIKDDVRRELVKKAGVGALLGGVDHNVKDSFEHLLESVARTSNLTTEDVKRYGSEASLRVIRILQLDGLPSEVRVQSIARRQRRNGWVYNARRAIFVGRSREFTQLSEFIRSPPSDDCRVLQVYGQAGVGKTTLVRRALTQFLDDPRYIFVDLDFERPVTSQNLVSFCGREIGAALFDADVLDERKLARIARDLDGLSEPESMTQILLDDAGDFLRSDKRLVIFLDSVEVYISAFNDPIPLMSLVEGLVEAFPGCVVITATRLSTFEYRVGIQNLSLSGISAKDVEEYCRLSDLDSIRAGFVVKNLPENNPLLVTLLIAAVKREKSFSLSELQNKSLLNNMLFQRFVVDRIISKIPDNLVRQIARAAIPLRRISEGLLFDSSIFPSVRDYYEISPGTLFDRLKAQIIFFEFHENEVYLRPDIRRTLLEIGLASNHKREYDVTREAAFAYYLKLSGDIDDVSVATEALYYALCLDKDRDTLESLWPKSLT